MIRRAQPADAAAVAALALQLWPDHTQQELREEFEPMLAEKEAAVFLAYAGGTAVGFAQCQLRHDYVEGTSSSPVGYLEGIFVAANHRRAGYAGALLKACEGWAREMGCQEFASDCELDNEDSLRFHLRMGFAEVGRIICFQKSLV